MAIYDIINFIEFIDLRKMNRDELATGTEASRSYEKKGLKGKKIERRRICIIRQNH